MIELQRIRDGRPIRGVFAGRLAERWARSPQGLPDGPPVALSPMIHRIEDLPQIRCPHCGRQMIRRGADYNCACGWGFKAVGRIAYAARDARAAGDPGALLPCWRRRFRGPEPVPGPEEVRARAAVIRAFRRRARQLAMQAARGKEDER